MDLSKSYGYNKELANNGVKMITGPDEGKDYILICRMPNENYKKELLKVFQANDKLLSYLRVQDKEAAADKDQELLSGILAKTVIIGWGDNFSDVGKKLKYSVETCAKILTKYPEFKDDCVEFAQTNSNYPLEVDVEETKKK